MRFHEGRSIYQQIVEYVEDQILTGRWDEDARVPSVRELAVELGVNPNTVQRSYATLQDTGVIYNQRGVGYFVASGGKKRSLDRRRSEFERNVLPGVFETMEMIGYSMNDVSALWERRREHDSERGEE
ncbi:MAG: GntR family transcriptional regulator [Alkalispirochaeta sp.]